MASKNVYSKWVSNNLVFYDKSGNAIVTIDGALRAFTVAAGATVLGAPQTLRVRATIAQINAGLDLLPAVAGYKYRLIDATLIAVGGAAGAATAVTITGVQATSTVALISVAIAALTQSTVVKMGTANVLADGASLVQNDVNTKIAIAKTGSALTTATSIDVVLTYALEA